VLRTSLRSAACLRLVLASIAGVLLCVNVAAAQSTEPDPWEQARWRFGPLAVTPTVQLRNLGVDTNVFNEVNDPKKDFTTTVAGGADWWLRLGRARLLGTDVVEGVYFATYASERSINYFHRLTFEYPLNRIRPYVGGSYVNTKDRPGYEIDARARHTEWGTRAGVAIRATGKTIFDLSASQITTRSLAMPRFRARISRRSSIAKPRRLRARSATS